MSIPNPEITFGNLASCDTASMASDRIPSEPLKPIFTNSIMPLVSNIQKLMHSQEGLKGPGTRLTATSYNVIRLHLRRRQPSDRIPAGSDLETTPRQSDLRMPEKRQEPETDDMERSMEIKRKTSDAKATKMLERTSRRRSHSRSPKRSPSRSLRRTGLPKMRQAVANPRRAITQPRRTTSNLDLPVVASDAGPPPAGERFPETGANCSDYSSAGCGSLNECWLDPATTSDFISQSDGTLRLPKKRRNSMTYDEWLTLKRKEAYQRQRQRRRDANRLAAAEEVRKQMSEKCYTEWLASKQKCNRHQPQTSSAKGEEAQLRGSDQRLHQHLPHMQVLSGTRPWRSRTISNYRTSTEAMGSRVQQWERNKVLEEDRRRLLRRREQADREAEVEERRRLSKMAWDRWLIQVTGKSPASQSLNSMGKTTTSQRDSNAEVKTLQGAGSRLTRKRRHGNRHPVPPSIAQRALRQRLNNMDGVQMYRNRK